MLGAARERARAQASRAEEDVEEKEGGEARRARAIQLGEYNPAARLQLRAWKLYHARRGRRAATTSASSPSPRAAHAAAALLRPRRQSSEQQERCAEHGFSSAASSQAQHQAVSAACIVRLQLLCSARTCGGLLFKQA